MTEQRTKETRDECRCTCGLYANPACPCRYADCACKRFWNGDLVQRHPEQRK